MAYTLEEMAIEIRTLLKKTDHTNPKGRADDLCAIVNKALTDEEFKAKHLTPRGAGEDAREILYEDEELGFCICGHVYEGEASGNPHDHGPSWALYGQAEGVTEMTEWRIVQRGDGDKPTLVAPDHSYEMKPGDAHYYGVGDVHSPRRASSTKLVRLEGCDLGTIKRTKIRAAESVPAE